MLTHVQLPDNMDELKALLSVQSAEIEGFKLERETWKQVSSDDKQEIQRLTLLLELFKRKLFGQKSEKLNWQIEQLELALEALHIT